MILNRISPSIYPRLKAMIEEQTGLLVYGYLPEKKELQVESRYLGLRLPGEMETMKETLKRLEARQKRPSTLRDSFPWQKQPG